MHTPPFILSEKNGYSPDINIFPNYYGHKHADTEAFLKVSHLKRHKLKTCAVFVYLVSLQ